MASARDFQIAQALVLIAVAAFVGVRFLPARHRQRVGFTLTICYVAGIAGYVIYVLIR